MVKILFLLTGGAIGTLARYGVSMWIQKQISHPFPLGILAVNVLGSFLIGFCWHLSGTFNLPYHFKIFLFTGIFGGFTTFSSFSLDTMMLLKENEYKLGIFNILANNLLGIIAVFAGFFIAKQLMPK
ncbi:fluoride efflux transporter CrcB [Parabacteroides sp. PF5-9]|uniref:fluoride efflux transporter CrcB n=1 Tax=Parabacteroides sp. PF5-9 TaxID=1742404 RepID=UPI0024740091|nr:fluoride efflux transporter CrcB [Parabacteroides sp. PF5-9]MDH6357396.1 CrcB protein [Parabacteroides sp. PF5-9]